MRLIIALLFPFFGMTQSFRNLRIDNTSKTNVTVRENLVLSDVKYYSIIYFNQDKIVRPDSVVVSVRSLGKETFAAQLRMSPDSSKIRGKVILVASDSLGWCRLAVPFYDFNVDSANSLRMYINSGSKAGFEISNIEFKMKSPPPVVVDPPTASKPNKPSPDFSMPDIVRIFDSLMSLRPKPDTTEFISGQGVKGLKINLFRNEKKQVVVDIIKN